MPLALPGSDSYGQSEEGGALSFGRMGLGTGELACVLACMQVGRKQAATERSGRKGVSEEGERDRGVGVRQSGGAHAGRGLSQA